MGAVVNKESLDLMIAETFQSQLHGRVCEVYIQVIVGTQKNLRAT